MSPRRSRARRIVHSGDVGIGSVEPVLPVGPPLITPAVTIEPSIVASAGHHHVAAAVHVAVDVVGLSADAAELEVVERIAAAVAREQRAREHAAGIAQHGHFEPARAASDGGGRGHRRRVVAVVLHVAPESSAGEDHFARPPRRCRRGSRRAPRRWRSTHPLPRRTRATLLRGGLVRALERARRGEHRRRQPREDQHRDEGHDERAAAPRRCSKVFGRHGVNRCGSARPSRRCA
jgi:hypothetical protein